MNSSIKIKNMQDEQTNKKQKLMLELGKIIRKHRKKQNKTMYLISAETLMSKSTWREAELGVCKDMNISTLWKISEGLGLKPSDLIEELSKALGKNFSLTGLDNI